MLRAGFARPKASLRRNSICSGAHFSYMESRLGFTLHKSLHCSFRYVSRVLPSGLAQETLALMSERSSSTTEVITKIRTINAVKSNEAGTRYTPVMFNFGVNMDETERKSDSVKLNFQLNMDSEPSLVKFVIEGTVNLVGDQSEIEKLLSADQSGVPQVFARVYQDIYAVLFLLSGNLDVPYPSPALLKRTQVKAAIS